MEKLFLGPLLARQELDVVDQQDVHAAELVAEGGHLVVTQRGVHVIGEVLAVDIGEGRLRLRALYLVRDGLNQMSLSHTHAAIQEQGVVSFRWTLRLRLARRMRELVSRADYESVECIPRIQ